MSDDAAASKRDGRSAALRGTARTRLLDAALREFRDHGYAGTSLQAIAQRAGLTKGAIYWSFKDKRELFRALVEERLDMPVRELMRFTEHAPADVETAPLISRGIAEIMRKQPDLLLLAVEQWRLAVGDESLREEFRERQQRLHSITAHTLRARHETVDVPLTYPAERLATAFVALAAGLAMEALIQPDAVPEDLLGDIFSLVYDGLVHRAQAQATQPSASSPRVRG